MALYAGIDVGGTSIKIGIADEHDRPVAFGSIPTERAGPPAQAIKAIALELDRLTLGRKLTAVAAGVPGPLDAARRILITAVNLKGWTRVRMPEMLRRALGVPCYMENDANCAAVGEFAAGAGRDAKCMVLFTLGTGVGGGIIIEGRLWVGANGGAGELGHIVVDPKGPRCGCGQHGCVEAFSSASAVIARYRERSGERVAEARDVFARASRGDKAARETVDVAGRMLGAGVSAVLHVLHPDVVVLGGGMAAGAGLLETVRREVARRVFPMFLRGLRIGRASLGESAGWIGAARVARERSSV